MSFNMLPEEIQKALEKVPHDVLVKKIMELVNPISTEKRDDEFYEYNDLIFDTSDTPSPMRLVYPRSRPLGKKGFDLIVENLKKGMALGTISKKISLGGITFVFLEPDILTVEDAHTTAPRKVEDPLRFAAVDPKFDVRKLSLPEYIEYVAKDFQKNKSRGVSNAASFWSDPEIIISVWPGFARSIPHTLIYTKPMREPDPDESYPDPRLLVSRSREKKEVKLTPEEEALMNSVLKIAIHGAEEKFDELILSEDPAPKEKPEVVAHTFDFMPDEPEDNKWDAIADAREKEVLEKAHMYEMMKRSRPT